MSQLKNSYRRLIAAGTLTKDKAQADAIEHLARLERALDAQRSWWRPWLGLAPKAFGLYLWGPPGRGKSFMMDLFYNAVKKTPKVRVHFHAFMRDVHHDIAQWRELDPKAKQAYFGTNKGDDPIPPVAARIRKQAKLLCFDEFQVTDIADAMILGRLFEALLKKGVIIVATSNRPPDDLYKNGLNRDLFTPFITLIKSRLKIIDVMGPKDFRMDRLRAARLYFCPTSAAEEAKGFDDLWHDMTALNEEREAQFIVNERMISFKRAAGPLLRVSFNEICAQNFGPSDYLAVAERFTTVFIEDVPILGPHNRNEAKRFVTLIDALYETVHKVVILAQAEPAGLYTQGDGAFEFARTVSRLEEMRSLDYLNRTH